MNSYINQKAAIYDKWLFTLGGGEQVAFIFAHILAKLGFQTEILTHQRIDQKQIDKKFGINLKNITIKYLPDLNLQQLSELSREYNLFANHSQLDYFPCYAKHSILYVSFPDKIKSGLINLLKKTIIVPFLRYFFIYISRYENFQTSANQYLINNQSKLFFNHPQKKVQIKLLFNQMVISVLDQLFLKVNDQNQSIQIQRTVNPNTNMVTFNINSFQKNISNITFCLPEINPDLHLKIYLKKININNFRYFCYQLFKYFLPRFEIRLHGGDATTNINDLTSYSKIYCHSNYVQKWINNYWHLPSEVLYPPVAVDQFKPAKNKKNIILNIGRFFVSGHSKKQLDLVKVFKKIIDQGIKDWELHLVGSVADADIHHQYFNQVIEESKLYPIFIHQNLSFTELKDLLSVSKIYWHATGLDENQEKNPINCEHFGISTVEAMAAGAVPVVINKGGQPEIVIENTGYLWNTRKELIYQTINLINHPELMFTIGKAAIKRAQFFSQENYQKKLIKSLTQFLS